MEEDGEEAEGRAAASRAGQRQAVDFASQRRQSKVYKCPRRQTNIAAEKLRS